MLCEFIFRVRPSPPKIYQFSGINHIVIFSRQVLLNLIFWYSLEHISMDIIMPCSRDLIIISEMCIFQVISLYEQFFINGKFLHKTGMFFNSRRQKFDMVFEYFSILGNNSKPIDGPLGSSKIFIQTNLETKMQNQP